MVLSTEQKMNASRRLNRKIAGVMVPLFSIRTEKNFGIGEILDLIPFLDWMAGHHLSLLQILPLYECVPNETSPYQALSSFAIDPIYLSLQQWKDFKDNPEGGQYLKFRSVQDDLTRWRQSKSVCYEPIRKLKDRMLRIAFTRFKTQEWDQRTTRAIAFEKFIREKSSWLDEYALFRILKERYHGSCWTEWPIPFRKQDPDALRQFAHDEENSLLFIKYIQWALFEQWSIVRKYARTLKIRIMGDLPFLVGRDSADVWGRQQEFSLCHSVGAPPDDFSADGQEWGLPMFHRETMQRDDFAWWQLRAREAGTLYDMLRLDHVVGFFRTWVIPKEGAPYFDLENEAQQVVCGEMMLKALIQALGDCIPLAEDLGVIPDFVRQSLAQQQIPGHKILRWEKWGHQYNPPEDYPFLSMATTGTHDTSTLCQWWNEIAIEERANFIKILDHPDEISSDSDFSEVLHKKIIDCILRTTSCLVVLPIQDILAIEDRINLPNTVGPHNWRFRIPLLLSELDQQSPYRERLSSLKSLIERHRRTVPGNAS
ncbi:MAG: 4-alpha-glucanotransferase [Nitrospiria bacterium]